MIYYLAIAAIGYIGYKKWNNEINHIFIKSVYEISKLYHIANDYFANDNVNDNKIVIEDIKKELIEIKEDRQNILELDITKEEFLNKVKNRILILSINDNKKILKEEDYDKITSLEKINTLEKKIFLQIIVLNNNKETDIKDLIKGYMVEGNEILDYKFLKWFMGYLYNIELKEDYKVNIMDDDIKLFTITKNESIQLLSDSYEILNKKKV